MEEEKVVIELSQEDSQVLGILGVVLAIGMGTMLYGFACAVGIADKASSKASDFLSDKIVKGIKIKRLEKSLNEESKKGEETNENAL